VDTGLEALKKAFFQGRYGSGYSICPCTKLICRELYQKVKFLEGCSIAEDVLYCAQLYALSKTVAKLDKTFYTYFQSESSAMRSEYRVRRADEVDADYRLMDVMDATGDKELMTFGASHYLGKLVMHWMHCHSRGDQHVFAEKADELRRQFKENYPRLKGRLSSKERLKYGMFAFVPGVFFRVYGAHLSKKGR
jgi:hypothetical protein